MSRPEWGDALYEPFVAFRSAKAAPVTDKGLGP